MFLFCVFGLFAYSFYCGSVLVIKKFPNNIKITTKSGKFEIHHEKDQFDEVIYVEPDHLNDCKEDCPGMEFDDKVNLDESKYTGGDMLACFLGVLFGVFSLAFTLPNFQQIVDGKSSGWYAYQIIERKPEILRDDPSKSYKNLNGDIEFKDVSFSYDSKKQVLRSINLNIEYGKTTAIVGQSGSGKSTIVQLIERFYDPQAGEVIINGLGVKEYNLTQLRSQIGYVGQEPILFNMSIRENIVYGMPHGHHVSDDEIIATLRIANADFVL